MKLRPVHLVWFLLLGATLAMGAVAFWLLGREAKRVEDLARETLVNRATTVADNLDFLVSEIRSGVGESLYALADAGDRRGAMARLVASNPFIAAGFQLREADGVTFWFGNRGSRPDPSQVLTPEILSEERIVETLEEEIHSPVVDTENVESDSAPVRSRAPTDRLEESKVQPEILAFREMEEKVADEEIPSAAVESRKAKSALKQQIAVVRELNVANRREILEAQQAEPSPPVGADDEQILLAGEPQVANRGSATSGSVSGLVLADSEPASLPMAEPEVEESPSERPKKSRRGEGDFGALFGFSPSVESDPLVDDDETDSAGLGGERSDLESDELAAMFGFSAPSEDRANPVSDARIGASGDYDLASLFGLSGARDNRSEPAPVSGWLTAPVEGEENQLGWIRFPGENLVLGAWLDPEAIDAELAKAVYLNEREGLGIRLIRPDGEILSAGRVEDSDTATSSKIDSIEIPVGPSLAGWRLRAFEFGGNPFGQSFRILGAVVVSGLVLAILSAGSLLLRQSRKDALEAQRKTTFVANVSHELKTPLTSIRMFAEMLAEGRVSDPQKRDRYLERISAETQRLGRLVNNVLDFSRLDRQKRDFRLEDRDLVEEVQAFLEMQGSRLAEEGLSVEFDPSGPPVRAIVDPDALEQILLNLLDNAVKYALEGERVCIEVEKLPNAAELRVRDFGPGIPPRERERVFRAFHRVDDRLTSEQSGCGLGLSIGMRLAAGMGIQLKLEENQPRGCCFILRWPERKEQNG